MITTNYAYCSGSQGGYILKYLQSDGENSAQLVLGNGTSSLVYNFDLADGEWHHLVVAFSKTKAYLYVDGQDIGRLSGAYQQTDTNVDFARATSIPDECAEYDQSGFNGRIDDISVYNYVLNESDVMTLYQEAVTLFLPLILK